MLPFKVVVSRLQLTEFSGSNENPGLAIVHMLAQIEPYSTYEAPAELAADPTSAYGLVVSRVQKDFGRNSTVASAVQKSLAAYEIFQRP